MPFYIGERRISGLGIDQTAYYVQDVIYTTPLELKTNVPTGQAGQAYMVGTGDQLTMYIWDTVNSNWSESSLYVPISDVGLIAARGYKALLRTVDVANNNIKLQYCYEDDVTGAWSDIITFYEGTRATAESARVAAELSRVGVEALRVTAETNRVTAEGNRVTAETGRVGAEGTRVTAETSRGASEALRASAETSRSNAEGNRVSAETGRVSAESARVSAESARAGAETSRGSAETLRVSAETTRGTNETNRINAEALRVTYNNQYRVLEVFNPSKSGGYKQYNKVIYDGSTYEAKSDVPMGTLPTNGTYWAMIASKATLGENDMAALVTQLTTDTNMENTFVKKTLLGQANGAASLDSNGKVPSAQLPGYVDDIVEGYFKSADNLFYTTSEYTTAITGESSKIYVDIGGTNKTFRYSGATFVEISQGVVLGETSLTAYRGDYGKIAYTHSQTAHAPSTADANVITDIKLNGVSLPITSKSVDIVFTAVAFQDLTITSSNWNTSTKKQSVAVTGMTSSSNAALYVVTQAGKTLFSKCGVTIDSQGANTLTLAYSSSSAPNADVACRIEIVQ